MCCSTAARRSHNTTFITSTRKNASGPVFSNPFPALAATGRRFVERHTVAVQQIISCPAFSTQGGRHSDLPSDAKKTEANRSAIQI